MMKKTVSLLLLFLLLISLISACSGEKVDTETLQNGERTYADYINSGAVIALNTGNVLYQALAVDFFKAKQVPEYTETADMLESIKKGRVDAAIVDSSYITQLADSGSFPDFEYLWVPKEVLVNESSHVFHTTELRDKYNEWLAQIIADGSYDEMKARWIDVPLPKQEDIPVIPLTGENGTLVMCDTGNYPPLSYFDENGNPTGFNAEFARRFAEHLGMNVEFVMMSYEAIGPYVLSGKADMSAVMIEVNEERKQSMIFGDPAWMSQAVLIVKAQSVGNAQSYTDFAGKTVGAITGTIFDEINESIDAKTAYYSTEAAAIEDVRNKKIDGFMYDLSAVRVMAATPGNEMMECLEVPAEYFMCPMGALSMNQDIIDRFNAFLAKATADGTIAEMKTRWLEKVPDLDAPMPDIKLTDDNGTLKVATSLQSLPFVFAGSNGEVKGYSAELAIRFAAHEGMNIEFIDMDFGGMIPYVISGKADFAIANVSITEERKKSVLFSDSIYDDQAAIIALKTGISAGDYTQFQGKKFAVMTGSVFDEIADRIFNASEKLYFNNVIDEIQAVHQGKADAALLDHVVAMVNLSGGNFDSLTTTEVPLEELNFRYSVFSDKQDMIDKYNEFLKTIKENGVYDDMTNRWFTDFDMSRQTPDIPLASTNGVLRVAINAAYPPFVYLGDNGKWSGFDIEQFYRFAEYLKMDIEFTDMEFGALLPYVTSGKCDIASSIYYTEERAKSVIFGDTDYVGKTVLVHKKDTTTPQTTTGFFEWIKTGIERNLIKDNRWKMIVNGLCVTMIIAFAAQFFGTVFGSFVCYILTRKNRPLRWFGSFYCGLIHGTPIVVLLMITYYIIFGNTDISNVLVAIAAFTMITGAGVAQTLKGAIDTVDPVEIEAARSIGFSAFKAFKTVTLPQAVRRALPSYTNGFVELVKATAIVGYIAIQDLTRAGDIIRSRTYDAYFPLLFVAFIYLAITTLSVQLFKFIIKKINGGAAA